LAWRLLIDTDGLREETVKIMDTSDMNERVSAEMYAIDESKMNRLSQTLWKYESEKKKANLRDPPVKEMPGGPRRT
jgi:hypothetical protein